MRDLGPVVIATTDIKSARSAKKYFDSQGFISAVAVDRRVRDSKATLTVCVPSTKNLSQDDWISEIQASLADLLPDAPIETIR
jgi:hypothetical protein